MDESLLELENELKRLTPRGPSPALLAALEREFGTAATTSAPARHYSAATNLSPWKWASWSLAGVAAAAALVVIVQMIRRPAAAPVESDSPAAEMAAAVPAKPAETEVVANRYEPVRATSVLYDLQEGDPTLLPDRTEGREVRYRYVDTYTWKNPATKASVRWSVPRDEVRLIRANLD